MAGACPLLGCFCLYVVSGRPQERPGVLVPCTAGFSGLRPVPSLPSRPFGFNPSRLRACGAARFACLQGKALRAIPAARCLAPLDAAEPAAPDRPGQRLRLGRCRELAFSLAHQHRRAAFERAGNLEDQR